MGRGGVVGGCVGDMHIYLRLEISTLLEEEGLEVMK
jgi:hypothetical protein